MAYTLRHGIASLTAGQFAALRALAVPKLVVYGAGDPQMSAADAGATASRLGAPAPVAIPGRHLTMISSPHQLAAAASEPLKSQPGYGDALQQSRDAGAGHHGMTGNRRTVLP